MADSEWFCVELPDGTKVTQDKLMRVFEFENKERAVEVARVLAPQYDQPLTVVKYSRKAVRVFTRSVSISEADVTAT